MTKKKQENTEQILTEREMALIDKGSDQGRIRGLELALLRKELEKLQKELTLLSANYTLKGKEIEDLNRRITEKIESNGKEGKKHKLLTDKIKIKFNLPDQWGFDPLTGKIKE